jgi:PAS domain-containing protein
MSLIGELEFRSLLDKLPAGAYTCDAQGLITYFN